MAEELQSRFAPSITPLPPPTPAPSFRGSASLHVPLFAHVFNSSDLPHAFGFLNALLLFRAEAARGCSWALP